MLPSTGVNAPAQGDLLCHPLVLQREELRDLSRQFDRWNAALQTRDPETVASLYAPDGILLPTVSNKVRTDHASKVSGAKLAHAWPVGWRRVSCYQSLPAAQ